MQIPHISVLPKQVQETFSQINEGFIIDATLGFGGHSELLLRQNKNLQIIACDKDEEALSFAKKRLEEFAGRIVFIKDDFKSVFKHLSKDKLEKIRGILADIGVSSWQLDNDKRGFSTASNFLDMRMDKSKDFNAFTLVNSYSEEKLEQIFKEFGELSNAKELAAKIIKARAKTPIQSGKALSEIIGNFKVKGRKIPQSTLVFQALRIEVNKELESLREFLDEIERLSRENLLKNCLVCVICFHSLEDSIVKAYFKKWNAKCLCKDRCECKKDKALGEILTKKPLVPSKSEIAENSRSSCAKMRVFKMKD